MAQRRTCEFVTPPMMTPPPIPTALLLMTVVSLSTRLAPTFENTQPPLVRFAGADAQRGGRGGDTQQERQRAEPAHSNEPGARIARANSRLQYQVDVLSLVDGVLLRVDRADRLTRSSRTEGNFPQGPAS